MAIVIATECRVSHLIPPKNVIKCAYEKLKFPFNLRTESRCDCNDDGIVVFIGVVCVASVSSLFRDFGNFPRLYCEQRKYHFSSPIVVIINAI